MVSFSAKIDFMGAMPVSLETSRNTLSIGGAPKGVSLTFPKKFS
jgi:hypothetical protein